jgi:hypothetical protein
LSCGLPVHRQVQLSLNRVLDGLHDVAHVLRKPRQLLDSFAVGVGNDLEIDFQTTCPVLLRALDDGTTAGEITLYLRLRNIDFDAQGLRAPGDLRQ